MKRIFGYGALIVAFVATVGCAAILHGVPLGKTYEYNMHGAVSMSSAEEFRNFIKTKGYGDTIRMHIESPGGLMLSMHKIIHHMKKTKAKIECSVDSHAASAAAMILTNCDKIQVTEHAFILFHMTQVCVKSGALGCEKRVPANAIEHPEAWSEGYDFLYKVKYLFTNKEWTAILTGDDITFKGKDFMERLRRAK